MCILIERKVERSEKQKTLTLPKEERFPASDANEMSVLNMNLLLPFTVDCSRVLSKKPMTDITIAALRTAFQSIGMVALSKWCCSVGGVWRYAAEAVVAVGTTAATVVTVVMVVVAMVVGGSRARGTTIAVHHHYHHHHHGHHHYHYHQF